MSKDAIRRASEAGQQVLRALSAGFQEEWHKRQMWPSTQPGDRQWRSPLGGEAVTKSEGPKPTTNRTEKMKW
jgi:hypothetical protein